MLRRNRNLVLLVVIIVGIAGGEALLFPSTASAYHTYDTRLLDNTAYSLKRRQFRFGLLKQSYGAFDFFQISTYTAPWLLGLVIEDVAPNIEFKSTFYDRGRLALSVSAGFLTGTLEQFTVEDASTGEQIGNQRRLRYFMTPVSLASSIRINNWVSTHIGGTYTGTQGDANAGLGSNDVGGSAVIDLLQLWAMAEWRLSKVVAFTFTLRWVPWVSDTVVTGRILVDQGNPDINVQVELTFIDLKNAFAAIPGFTFSWERANIRLGVGYGDLFTDFIGFPLALPRDLLRGISPEFDIFVRF